jgi:hypothetical protein
LEFFAFFLSFYIYFVLLEPWFCIYAPSPPFFSQNNIIISSLVCSCLCITLGVLPKLGSMKKRKPTAEKIFLLVKFALYGTPLLWINDTVTLTPPPPQTCENHPVCQHGFFCA